MMIDFLPIDKLRYRLQVGLKLNYDDKLVNCTTLDDRSSSLILVGLVLYALW